ncbi:MAG: hypothetical protein KBF43_04315 [Dermatophilaceae bacterium]|nr:hypothetical protein [Dermatophilaceae bacterium]
MWWLVGAAGANAVLLVVIVIVVVVVVKARRRAPRAGQASVAARPRTSPMNDRSPVHLG